MARFLGGERGLNGDAIDRRSSQELAVCKATKTQVQLLVWCVQCTYVQGDTDRIGLESSRNCDPSRSGKPPRKIRLGIAHTQLQKFK